MVRRIGPLPAEITEGENDKFTAPLLLVHGLWDTGAVWRRFAGYLTHRGWRCVAVSLRGRADTQPAGGLAEHLSDLRAAIAALDAPPVLVGHDLGALLALQSAVVARAVVALAPLVPTSLAPQASAALKHAGNWLARWRGQPLSAPIGRWLQAYPSRWEQIDEPATVVCQLLAGSLRVEPVPKSVPSLVLTGEHDPVTSVEAAEALADCVRAEFQVFTGAGHVLPNEAGWERRVATIHSWLVQRLGVDLLALYEQAMQDDESKR